MQTRLAALRSAYEYVHQGIHLVSENLSLHEHEVPFEVAASPFVPMVRPSPTIMAVFKRLQHLYFALGTTGFVVAVMATAMFAMTQAIFQSKRAASRLKELRQLRSTTDTTNRRCSGILRFWRQHASVVDNTVPFWRSQMGLELEQAVVIAGFFGMGVVFTLLHMGINI